MGVYKRADSPYWWVSFQAPNGKRLRRSAESADKEEAKRLLRKLEQEVWEQKHLKKKAPRYWLEAVARYIKTTMISETNVADFKSRLKWLKPHLEHKALHEIDRRYIEYIVEQKEKEGSAPATINKYLSVISAILNKAYKEWDWIDAVPPIKKRKEPSSRVRWESPTVIAQLGAKLQEDGLQHQYYAMIFALATGLRKRNVVRHEKAWVNRELGITTIPGHYFKNKKPHTVPLNTIALWVVDQVWNDHDAYLFTYEKSSKTKERVPLKELNTKAWRRVLKELEIKDFRWHDLRHTWASWMAQNGESLLEIMQGGGWSDTRMVKRYAHLAPEHLKKSFDKLSSKQLSGLLPGKAANQGENVVTILSHLKENKHRDTN